MNEMSLIERDYFTDYEILKDPYAFFEAIREQGPVYQPPGKDYYIVTGFEEALEVLRNHEDFSAIIGLQGAAAPLPFTPQGSDITAQIEAHRKEFVGGDQVVNLDDEPHTKLRALRSTRCSCPRGSRRARSSSPTIRTRWSRKAVADGEVELIEQDRHALRHHGHRRPARRAGRGPPDLHGRDRQGAAPGQPRRRQPDGRRETIPSWSWASYFAGYIADRRANPRDDILTELAHAKYPDGTTPSCYDLVQLGMFMFGAGQDTSAKLLGNAMKYLVERARPAGPAARRSLADPGLPRGSAAARRLDQADRAPRAQGHQDRRRRDPGRHQDPASRCRPPTAIRAAGRTRNELILGRPKIKEHVGFGRGKHVCAGAPLARVEVRVILEKFLEHTSKIELDPREAPERRRRPRTTSRASSSAASPSMHLKLTPAEGFVAPGRSAAAAAAAKALVSTAKSRIGDLLDRRRRHGRCSKSTSPAWRTTRRSAMAKGMTLRAVQSFAPDKFTTEALDAVDADLAQPAA